MGITAPATFNGTVTFTATAATGGATVQVPITVNVTPAPTLVSTNCPGPTRAGGVTTGLPCVAPSGTTPANTVAFTGLTGTVPPGGFNVCQFVDVYATGGVVPNVTATLSSAWASFNDIAFVQTLNLGNLTTTGVLNQPPAPGGLPVNGLGFPICVNQSLAPQGAGTVTTNITIQGSGVGTITIPVTFITSPNSPGAANFKQIGIFRNSIAGLGAGFVLDSNTTGANYTTATTGPSGSSAIRENCLLSHTTATCLAETIEEGLTDHALRQRITASAGAMVRERYSKWEDEIARIYEFLCDPEERSASL